MQRVCIMRALRRQDFTKNTLISVLNTTSRRPVCRQIPEEGQMVLLSRRHALAAGLGACAATFSGTQASARALIALPDDIINTDAATITAISTSSPVVAMTFDDGRRPTNTPHLLDMLRERDIRATFNIIGNRVVQCPAIARRIAEEGHEIGNHSYTHPFLDRLGASSVTNEIDRTSDATFQVTGRPPLTFRPPYGAFTRNQRTGLHAARALPTILWSVDPLDWRRPHPATHPSRQHRSQPRHPPRHDRRHAPDPRRADSARAAICHRQPNDRLAIVAIAQVSPCCADGLTP
jgi:peptidoglycan/xylan/chitin deacetylase (PgdA/CDA1 family)